MSAEDRERPKAVQFLLYDPDPPDDARPLQMNIIKGVAEAREREREEWERRALAEEVINAINAPDVARGRKVGDAAREGGRTRRGKRKAGKVSDDQLRAEVDALVDEGETLTNARRRVGKAHRIPLSTVRDRTKK